MDKGSAERVFITLLERHAGIVHKIARLYCRNDADRADLIQDIHHQLWRTYPSYDPALRFSTWMYRVALNTAISMYRKRSNMEIREFDENRFEAHRADNGSSAVLMQAIAALPPLDKPLIMLHLDGHKYDEIAEIMGISATNVSTRLGRIKKRLKKIIQTQSK